MRIDTILTPAEFPALAQRNLTETTCVVFDVLRATSSMLSALNNGAEAIIPVSEVHEAVALKMKRGDILLAGERHGLRIRKDVTGSIDFDFGNSPRDFSPEKVVGKTIAWTTTNGTRALRACAHGEMILLGGLVNLIALADVLETLRPKNVLLVCAGTFETPAFEDIFAAGALIARLAHLVKNDALSDSAQVAWRTFQHASDINEISSASINARRLLANPDLAPDVSLCLASNSILLNASLLNDGTVRPMRGFAAKLA